MFGYLFKKINFFKMLHQSSSEKEISSEQLSEMKISSNLKQNLNMLQNILGTSDDLITREFSFGEKPKVKASLIFLDGMAKRSTINESIIKPLMYDSCLVNLEKKLTIDSIEMVRNTMLSVGEVEQVSSVSELVDSCLSGDTILLVDGFKEALIVCTKGWESRSVQEPKTEVVVRGPREGFTETLRTNTTLLRRKICDPNLIFETVQIGERTKTNVSVAYLKGIVNPRLLEEIRRRLKRIKIDAVLESGYIEQFIEDEPFSLFSTIANSEKPDVVAAKILEGRVAIFVDGTPMVLTVPMLFVESFQSAEDYYSRPYFSSLIRILRYTAFMVSVLAPSIYVALTTFHQEIIPTSLLITMAASREGIPFPAVLEAFIMIITFEILREAGVRLPRPVGQAVSIVGALVIGEAAVSAGLISAPMVIVVAITAISSFVVTPQNGAIGVLRLIFIILSGCMGLYGIVIGLLELLIHLSSLRSFGTPYLSPISPLSFRDMKDTFIRAPLWAMFTRPRAIGWRDPQREEFRLTPDSPSEEE
jgi:spore germination protein KA